MFNFIYPRIWPIIFVALGLMAAIGMHIHFEVLGLTINSHNLMWFLMAGAHADVLWRKQRHCRE